jgi:hypothetical protein
MRMTSSFTRAALPIWALVLASACGGSGDPAAGGGSASNPGAPAAGGTGPARAIMNEPFTTRVIEDPMQRIPAGVVAVPTNWRFQSEVRWNYAHHSAPVAGSMSAENPANEEAVFGHPAALFFDLRPRAAWFQPGQNHGGYVYAQPTSPLSTMVALIRRLRGQHPDLQFVGSKDLPGLAAALQIPQGPNQHGIGVKVQYTLNGRQVEEEFYGVHFRVDVPYDGPQGRTFQINWGLASPHSFRAPAGTLDQRRPVFAAIAKSYRVNPEWQARYNAILQYLAAEFNRQLQAGYDQIAAAVALSRQISANNDAMLATIQSQRQSAQASASASERTAAAKFDDYIRGVETVEDPYYGTSQRSNTQQFHWTDGYGTYRSSNDATYNPNHSEVGNWTIMKNIR